MARLTTRHRAGAERYTQADHGLIAELAAMNVRVGLRALQDWRRDGLVEHEHNIEGGRAGSQASYPERACGQVAQVVALLAQYGKLDLVVLAMFGVGHNPTEKALRRAFARLLDEDKAAGIRTLTAAEEGRSSFRDQVRRGSASINKEVPEVAGAINSLVRSLALAEAQDDDRNARAAGLPPGADAIPPQTRRREVREQVVTDFASALVDPDKSGHGGRDMFACLGFAEDEIDDMEDMGGPATFDEMRAALDCSPFGEIVAARDEARRGLTESPLPFAGGASPVIQFIVGHIDEPAVVGITIAMGVLSGLAFSRREVIAATDGYAMPARL
jgi:hypothetical protein